MLRKAVALAHPGDVLIVDNDGFLEAGLWGEIITVAAMQKGIVGLVTNGAVRDTRQIPDLGFSVFCGGISIKGTTKAAPGKINHAITFEGVIVNPGDIVVGDNDGLVVIPCAQAETLRGLEKNRKPRSSRRSSKVIRPWICSALTNLTNA
jgi:4-hydroxy-4-methyl-2-oxoglutarate aldolase